MKGHLLALLHGHGAMLAALGAAGAGGVLYLRRRQASSPAPATGQAVPGVIVPMPAFAGGGVAPTATTSTAPTQPAPTPAGGGDSLYGSAGTWIQTLRPAWPTPGIRHPAFPPPAPPAVHSWMTTTPNRGLGG